MNDTSEITEPQKASARKWLLTQNSQLRKEGIFNWTLPAFAVKLPDGTNFNVCPQASLMSRPSSPPGTPIRPSPTFSLCSASPPLLGFQPIGSRIS
ncbi:hypothetical protein AB0D66_28410 [Streptomyces sp. NPDC048270]|uniref:GP88 family protein n=1 Tax=Streptomyces sp. NPDC048270 TaxID=3154615 RepID=UPI0033EB775B